jgi:hypothetical protein
LVRQTQIYGFRFQKVKSKTKSARHYYGLLGLTRILRLKIPAFLEKNRADVDGSLAVSAANAIFAPL